MATFSERLQELKVSRGVMQKDVAAAIDVPLRTYQRYEYGEREPQLSTLVKMADFYGVTLDYLAGRSDTP
ncbi:MAG: helix-turn-helix transcriptional regulator [Oscillibacter sp.]|nr:helix-turn-helix transcriptional regulator [Oscillibacter sp.]